MDQKKYILPFYPTGAVRAGSNDQCWCPYNIYVFVDQESLQTGKKCEEEEHYHRSLRPDIKHYHFKLGNNVNRFRKGFPLACR